MTKLSTEGFIKRAVLVHGNTYKYTSTIYKGDSKKVEVLCKRHGLFTQNPSDHLNGHGCRRCGAEKIKEARTLTKKEFIKRAKEVYGLKYSYAKVEYKHSQTPVKIICKVHGLFEQTPSSHLMKHGCPKCGYEIASKAKTSNTLDFILKAKKIHGEMYNYDKVKYIRSSMKIKIICKVHGLFEQTPNNHLQGQNCPDCRPKSYSKIAIKWIEEYAYSHRMKNIQHAEKGGEYRIPGTRFTVDGYHKASNTVFEFHGDEWHGNPSLFKPRDRCNPFSNKTAKQLYKETIEREKYLKKLGYKVVSIWENEYRK
jgi:hypothetical protein